MGRVKGHTLLYLCSTMGFINSAPTWLCWYVLCCWWLKILGAAQVSNVTYTVKVSSETIYLYTSFAFNLCDPEVGMCDM